VKARDDVQDWCAAMPSLRFRDGLERKFWGDVFSASIERPTHSSEYYRSPEERADEAVIRMRLRQGTVEQIEFGESGPVGYQVCAVCERKADDIHANLCPWMGMFK
jgi:hypothetical protein